MRKPLTYLTGVMITLLMIFCLLGLTAGALVRCKAAQPDTFTGIIRSKDLAEKVHEHLTVYFTEQENVTGIPASVYERSVTAEKLRPMLLDTAEQAFLYLDGRTDYIGISPDMTELKEDLTAFFEQYAAENGYERDSKYDEVLTNAIRSATNNIKSACDVYRFSLLGDAGVMKKVRRALPHTKYLMIGCGAGIAVLLLILLMLHRQDKPAVLYWFGSAVLVSSLLMLIPAAWLQITHWFDRFAVKSDQVFAAVTGYLYTMTGTVITVSVIGIVLALCLYLFSGILRQRSAKA
ncbi:MAG: hypothetical protein K6E36_11215 [Oscillospiraceae bacterium]|nr:hypothetical protein [Oscillospiraceae bacterium]